MLRMLVTVAALAMLVAASPSSAGVLEQAKCKEAKAKATGR